MKMMMSNAIGLCSWIFLTVVYFVYVLDLWSIIFLYCFLVRCHFILPLQMFVFCLLCLQGPSSIRVIIHDSGSVLFPIHLQIDILTTSPIDMFTSNHCPLYMVSSLAYLLRKFSSFLELFSHLFIFTCIWNLYWDAQNKVHHFRCVHPVFCYLEGFKNWYCCRWSSSLGIL
jgi:hypothetical protein